MKKVLLIFAVSAMLTACTSLLHNDYDTDYGHVYQHGTETPPPPPPSNGSHGDYHYGNQPPAKPGNKYDKKPGYNNGYYGNNNPYDRSIHNSNNPYDNRNGKPYNNNMRRPNVGSIVKTLPSRNVTSKSVHNEKLYECEGVYYKPVRTNSGTGYQVVGYSN